MLYPIWRLYLQTYRSFFYFFLSYPFWANYEFHSYAQLPGALETMAQFVLAVIIMFVLTKFIVYNLSTSQWYLFIPHSQLLINFAAERKSCVSWNMNQIPACIYFYINASFPSQVCSFINMTLKHGKYGSKCCKTELIKLLWMLI